MDRPSSCSKNKISPSGELLKYIPIPEELVTNCAFGGDDLRTLYVTAR
jgi:gluconolactonase